MNKVERYVELRERIEKSQRQWSRDQQQNILTLDELWANLTSEERRLAQARWFPPH